MRSKDDRIVFTGFFQELLGSRFKLSRVFVLGHLARFDCNVMMRTCRVDVHASVDVTKLTFAQNVLERNAFAVENVVAVCRV